MVQGEEEGLLAEATFVRHLQGWQQVLRPALDPLTFLAFVSGNIGDVRMYIGCTIVNNLIPL